MSFKKPDQKYWDDKMIAYFHDPIDKVLDIRTHEERGAQILEIFGLQKPNEPFWKKADGIASGFERGQVPSYSKDDAKNGAIKYFKDETKNDNNSVSKFVLTHPTAKGKNHLEIDLSKIKPEDVFSALKKFLAENIGDKPGSKGFSNKEVFENNPGKFSYARFLYAHLGLRFKLAQENVGGLGALWHRLPADSRFPDHTIWQHNALVSALSSCMGESVDGKINEPGMMLWSITPVQPFIAKARKLRDYWTGSVILSWLAFEAIRWVIENLGCDHILYPSLIDQPLVNEYMKQQGVAGDGNDELNLLNRQYDIASFPNKILFLIPFEQASEIAGEINNAVQAKWLELRDMVCCEVIKDARLNETETKLNETETKLITGLFEKQFSEYWDFNWAATKLLAESDKPEIEKLLAKSVYENNFELLKIFNNIIEKKEYYEKSGKGVLYSVSHSLVQTALAAGKSKKVIRRAPEYGRKCQMCGEFEVLNTCNYDENSKMKANEYSDSIKEFWSGVSKKIGEKEIKENEYLCAICTTKRLASKVISSDKNHILHRTFNEPGGFPSTTEIALTDYYKTEKFLKKQISKKDEAQTIHDSENDDTNIRDRYYAILMMDGDKMGALVNGETIGATWDSITHPDMIERLKDKNFDPIYSENWKELLDDEKTKKRLLTPSIHASISESLGDFAIYGAASIVKKHAGRLIYAGGDDVCAILPVSTVLEAADEIRQYYNGTFKLIEDQHGKIKSSDINSETNVLSAGKLSVNLGVSDGISISAGILIAHHKDNLSGLIEEAHSLLDKAKSEGGRNAVAVQLKKRSGGSRYFVSKWEKNDGVDRFDLFKKLSGAGVVGDEVSRSLVYRLSAYKDGTEAMLDKPELLKKFVNLQLSRSGTGGKKDEREKLAEMITNLSLSGEGKNRTFNPEPLIIAAFIGNREDDK